MTPAELFASLDQRQPSAFENAADLDSIALIKAFSALKTPEQKKHALDAVRALAQQEIEPTSVSSTAFGQPIEPLATKPTKLKAAAPH